MPAIYFYKQLSLLETEVKSLNKKSPEQSLFHSQARNIFFRLEGLCRIYKRIANKSLFKLLQDEFKLFEDSLGRIDYYDTLYNDFIKVKGLPASFTGFFKDHLQHEYDQLSVLVKDIPVISPSYIEVLKERVGSASWITDADKERQAIGRVLIEYVDELTDEYKKGKYNFDELESGLHEFRRKLRWISIYAAAVDGLIQLKKIPVVNSDLRSYQTDAIVNLPYNKLPEPSKDIKPIFIEAPDFYALSWMIQELGRLKDVGQKWEAIDEVLKQNKAIKNIALIKKSLRQSMELSPADVSAQAQIIVDDFIFKHGVLSRIKRSLYRSLQ
jgi:hypothetical protein